MSSSSDTRSKCVFTVLTAGLTVSLCYGLTSQTGIVQLSTLSSNGSALCPKGWSLAAPSVTGHNRSPKKLCLRVVEQLQSWDRARHECRRSRGFLVKMDSVLTVGNKKLADYLRMKGIDSVWTGMHHKQKTLLWDEMHPHMVKAYYGQAEKYGWRKRGWRLEPESFKLGNETCGRFQVTAKESKDLSRGGDGSRRKRSPKQRQKVTRPRHPSSGDTRRRSPRLDNEDVLPSRSPNDDKRTETFRNFYNGPGSQDGNVDSGDPSNGGDHNTGGKADGSRRSRQPLRGTTASTTTTTDQSNLEDNDDPLLTTPKSSRHGNTTATDNPLTTKAFGNTTAVSKAPGSTSTTSLPYSSTSNDDIVNSFLEPPLHGSSNKDIGSLDGGGLDDQGDPSVLAQTKTPHATSEGSKSSETQTSGPDSKENTKLQSFRVNTTLNPLSAPKTTKPPVTKILTSILQSGTEEIAKLFNFNLSTSTALPQTVLGLPIILTTGANLGNVSSTSPDPRLTTNSSLDTTTSWNKLTSTEEDVKTILVEDDPQTKDAVKEEELKQSPVTPKYVTDQLKSTTENIISKSPETTAPLPASVEIVYPQSKESRKVDQMTPQPILTPKSVTQSFTSFIRNTSLPTTTTDIITTAHATQDSTSDSTKPPAVNIVNSLIINPANIPQPGPVTTNNPIFTSRSDATHTVSSTTSDVPSTSASISPVFTTTSDVLSASASTSAVFTTASSAVTGAPSTLPSDSVSEEVQPATNLTIITATNVTASVTPTYSFNTTAKENEDSREAIDATDASSFTSATSSLPNTTTTTTTATTDTTGSESVDMDLNLPILNTTFSENNSSMGIYQNTASNKTLQLYNTFSKPDSSKSLDSAEAFDRSTNSSNASINSIESAEDNEAKAGSTTEAMSSEKESATDNVDSPAISGESTNNISRPGFKDSQERDKFEDLDDKSADADEFSRQKPTSGPSATISLSTCDQEYASICVTEAIDDLTLVGHCDRNWYGHRLLDRCYKPVEYTLKAIEAKQSCLHYSASLATVDTDFYGNITAMLLSFFVPGSRVWVDASLNLDIPDDGRCTALEDGQLFKVDCNTRLPFICQKDAHFYAPYLEDRTEAENPVTYVQNMTSFYPQNLWCPLRMATFDDVILWFKDGRPIINQDESMDTIFGLQNGNVPNRLDLNLSILERVGDGGARILKPAMLQGLYWCEIWRRDPFHRVISHKIFLKFTDVITLYGHITTKPTSYLTAAIFNRMGHVIGLPASIERRLATMNKNITHYMRSVFPIVRDIVSFVKSTNPDTGRSEFTTYICVATGDLSAGMRGSLADLYLSSFYEALVHKENELRTEWNLTQPIRQAVSVSMADMCPGVNLMDNMTGLNATFPSTPVNSRTSSRNTCNGVSTGTAFCKGDLQTGAYWDNWSIVDPCNVRQPASTTQDYIGRSNSSAPETGSRDTSTDASVSNAAGGSPTSRSPMADLIELNDVRVQPSNVADVTNRLAVVIGQKDDLSASDIEKVAQVVNRIVSVDSPPAEISEKLIQTANKVLEAPDTELRKAEIQSQASTRLLADLETFGEKVKMDGGSRVRFVTPNIAMELWSLDDSNDIVIGFGATQTSSWSTPLSEPRIQTIKDRLWAEQHLSKFDIAIELPESLVKNTVRYSDSSLRLSMIIYRKTGLFVQEKETETVTGIVNSAIISASLGGRRIRGLEDKVKLVFKPFQAQRTPDSLPLCVFWDTEFGGHARWSRSGCAYNGTLNGRHVCLCDHLTNFAILTDFYGDEMPIPPGHETALTVLTIIGLVLSILGLAATIITFLAFKKLRQGRAQQTLFNMAVALLCFQIIFLVGVKQTSIMPVCLAVAVLLHYFILVSFAWMLIEAVLQYLTFVKVLGTYISRYTLKTVLPAWGVPLLPVISVLAADYKLYLGRINYCWMSLQAFYYAFALPVGIIIVFNIVMFFVIVVSIATRPKGLRSNQSNNKTRETSLKAAFTIFVLLGLTWIFGYLAIEDARLPFQYAFTTLSSLQGFLIFVLMVARRRQVREQWEASCCAKVKARNKKQKQLSPTFSNSSTSSHTLPSYTNNTYSSDSIILSSSTGGLRRQMSLNV